MSTSKISIWRTLLLVKLKQYTLQFPHDLIWKFKSCHIKDNIELIQDLDVKNISMKLKHDTDNFCGVMDCIHKAGWLWGRLKVHKGQCQTCLRIRCREHPCKVTTLLKSYDVHKVIWLRTGMKVKRSHKSQHWTHLRFRCGEYRYEVKTWHRQFLWSYHAQKVAWPWTSLQVQKGHKGQYWTHPRYWCEKHLYEVTK